MNATSDIAETILIPIQQTFEGINKKLTEAGKCTLCDATTVKKGQNFNLCKRY